MLTTINIRLNGDERSVPDRSTVAELITALELSGKRLAVEVNGEIVPRSSHQRHTLSKDDHVEIIHAVGGG